MRWLQTEYVLKGLFLSLLLVAALQQGINPPPPEDYGRTLLPVNLGMLGGLGVGLVLGSLLKLMQGYRPRGLFSFALFVLLECPTLVYIGILGGLFGGTLWILQEETRQLMTTILIGGAALGLGMGMLKDVRDRNSRIVIMLLVAAALVGGGIYGYTHAGDKLRDAKLVAIQLLIGLPFFYLLTFAGREEETEAEIGVICAGLGLALWILIPFDAGGPPTLKALPLLLPVILFLFYTLRILPGLRVAKHAFRGLSYARVGRYRLALLAFRRALQLDPTNRMARDGFWSVHKALDLTTLANDPNLLELVDFDLCLERAGSLLVNGRPTPTQLDEALRLLELVISQRPQLRPSYDYWTAVASTHQGNLDDACERLTRIIDPAGYGSDHPNRLRTLMPAWQLALLLHPVLKQRVGDPQIAIPGRRVEAIAATERVLAEAPDDGGARQLKQTLYRELRESEYLAVLPPGAEAVKVFDHDYARQLGLAAVVDADRWQHGIEYLHLAIRGIPLLSVGLLVEIAKAYDRQGESGGVPSLAYFEKAREAGRHIGQRNLPEAERATYFRTVKYLGDLALHFEETDRAIENFKLYTEAPTSGIETLRTLAGLYEKKGDVLSAIRATDAGLCHNGTDADLLQRKERYYYSLEADVLRANLEQVRPSFDVTYCIAKAKTILEGPMAQDEAWLDVARHLSELASIVSPANVASKLVQGRILLRYGERDRAIAVLEDARANKPTSWLSGDEEDAWMMAQQLLGDLYMEVGRADAAVACFQDFLRSHRAGAKTHFKLGQAYEQLQDTVRAIRAYKQVTAYEGNPLSSDAYDALNRLGA